MSSLSQDVIDAKYGELAGLRRNTLRQLAKQHSIHRRNKLTADELRSRLLDSFPCTRHTLECMLVHYDDEQSDSEQSDDENVSINQSIKSLAFAQPPASSDCNSVSQSLHQTPRTQDMRNRRKTWNPVDVKIGSCVLTPRRAPQSSARRITMSVRQSFSIAALNQPSDSDDTPYGEKDEFERENVNQKSVQEHTISQSLLSFACIDEDSDDSEDEQPKRSEQQAISQSINQAATERRRLSLAASKVTAERRKKAQDAHTARLNTQSATQSGTSSTQPIVPALAWPTKFSTSIKSNNENAPPTSARRQTIGGPVQKFDVPTSLARSTKRSVIAAPLTDRSNTPSCQSTTISAAAKTKASSRRSMKAQAEHVVEKRSIRAGARQANERRASMEIKRTTLSRAQENRA